MVVNFPPCFLKNSSCLNFKFKITSIALPAIGIGLPLVFSKVTKRKNLGEIFVGFGLLFLGLSLLKNAIPPIDPKNPPDFFSFLQSYSFDSFAQKGSVGLGW